mmetsp:Transcript_25454/g.85152  ORF Transcript_25454/g.85152 Transcript_25454/m.85152 type:complete len:209 (+) Transcript_25454:1116-1742(+)
MLGVRSHEVVACVPLLRARLRLWHLAQGRLRRPRQVAHHLELFVPLDLGGCRRGVYLRQPPPAPGLGVCGQRGHPLCQHGQLRLLVECDHAQGGAGAAARLGGTCPGAALRRLDGRGCRVLPSLRDMSGAVRRDRPGPSADLPPHLPQNVRLSLVLADTTRDRHDLPIPVPRSCCSSGPCCSSGAHSRVGPVNGDSRMIDRCKSWHGT